MDYHIVIGESRIIVRIRQPRPDRCMTSAAGGLIEQFKSTLESFSISSVRFPSLHAVLKHSKEKIAFIVRVAWRDSTWLQTTAAGVAIGDTPVSMGSDPTSGALYR